MQKYLVALGVVAVLFILPMTVGAADLVPECGGDGQPACQACYAVELVNNVVSWLVMILGVIAAILIVVAGARLVTSGGNASAMEAAKSSMTNLIIGYIIVLSAWLVMDYGLRALLVEGGSAQFGVWNAIGCVAQPVSNTVVVVQDPVDWISVGTEEGAIVRNECSSLPNGSYNCSAQRQICSNGGGVPREDTSTNPWRVICTYPPPAGGSAGAGQSSGSSGSGAVGGSCSVLNSGPCSVASLRPIFGSRAEDASRICNKESGGNPVESRSDICCGPGANCSGAPSFSGGLFQINILAHANLIPGCNLSSFFTRNGSTPQGNCVRRNARGICTGWSCSIVRNSAYNACMQGARNTTTNLRVTKILYDSRGFQPWANSRNLCSVR